MNAPEQAGDSPELEALFDSILSAGAPAAAPAARAPDVMSRVGQMTRMLHDALRELGYDRILEKAAAAIPDARDRLSYVATLTEQAATRALNATELARPIQDKLAADATRLGGAWQRLLDRQMTVGEFEALVGATREYLGAVPERTRATNAQLTEIMMAQDFQDLTGQVIKKITELAQSLEQQLVRLLVDLLSAEKRSEIDSGLLNGPVIDASGRSDVVTSQSQVDDLLESLGF